ncbi:UNVERIFIED_CONTAM: hypothetical protein FKN15_007942 [Acipenser sinensis]
MSTNVVETKKEAPVPGYHHANGAVHPVIPTEMRPGDCELKEVTSAPKKTEQQEGDLDADRAEVVVIKSRANAKGVLEEDALLENGSQSNDSDDTSTDQIQVLAPPLKETSFSIGLQVLVPFLLAGFGTVGAGIVLDIVQANIGHMDTAKEMWGMIVGNLALIQVQATVVGFLASIAAMMFGWIPEGHFKMGHAVLLCASSVTTAFVASLLLGLIMIGVIVGARKIGINPDNVATPIAASLGDLITLALLSSISWGLYKQMQSNDYMNMLVCAFFVALTPIWIIIARRTPSTREVLYSGWEPVIIAMAISSVGGLILDKTVSDPNFAGMAVFTPVINGVGGNLVAVQASRISTYLHMTGLPGAEPQANRPKCLNPCSAFFGSGCLTVLCCPRGMTGACVRVLILLYMADWMVHWMWGRGMDPDNFSIPYLTALGDLLGTGFLALSFHILWLIGDRDSDVGD